MDKRMRALAENGKPVGMIDVAMVSKISEALRFLGKDKPPGPITRAQIDRMMCQPKQESDFEMKCRLFGFSPAAIRASARRT